MFVESMITRQLTKHTKKKLSSNEHLFIIQQFQKKKRRRRRYDLKITSIILNNISTGKILGPRVRERTCFKYKINKRKITDF